MEPVRCACGAVLPRGTSTTVHSYIPSTAECWATFTEVLARQYSDPQRRALGLQLTVDAYAAQHPRGQPATSLIAHLVSLFEMFERHASPNEARESIRRFVHTRRTLPDLTPPENLGYLTIADVHAASDDDHLEEVRRWALHVWNAWYAEHATIAALTQT